MPPAGQAPRDAATAFSPSAARSLATIRHPEYRRFAREPSLRNSFAWSGRIAAHEFLDRLIEPQRDDRRRRTRVVDRNANAAQAMTLEEVGHHGLPHFAKAIRRRADFNCTRVGLRRRLDQNFQIARRDNTHDAGIRHRSAMATVESKLKSFHLNAPFAPQGRPKA